MGEGSSWVRLLYHLFMLYYNKLLTFSLFSDKDINKDREDREEEGWEQVDIDKTEEEMEKKKPLLHRALQARLLILHPKRHRPSSTSRRT